MIKKQAMCVMGSYLLLLLSVLLAVSDHALYHRAGEGDRFNPFLFTAVSSAAWVVLLLPGSNLLQLKRVEVLFGVLYGGVQAMFLFFKMKALSTGPVSVTSVVGNCSMILSTLFGIFAFAEIPSVPQIIGLCLIVLSVLLCVDSGSDMEMSRRWKIYCVLFFAFAASVGIVLKLFAAREASGSNMMLVSAVTMAVLLLLLSFASRQPMVLHKSRGVLAVLCGIAGCCYNRINVFLVGALPSVVFFPVFNGAVVLLSAVAGAVFYRERFSKKQVAGVFAGVAAILLLSGIFS